MSKGKEKNFKAALSALEKAVKGLENGDVDLEKAVEIFVEGMKSAALCQSILNESQQKIEIALKETNKAKESLQNFEPKNANDIDREKKENEA